MDHYPIKFHAHSRRFLLESSRIKEYSQDPMQISLNLTQCRSKRAYVHYSAGHIGPAYSTTHCVKAWVVLVSQGGILGGL